MGKKKKAPQITTLSYKKGDLIFKEGDYGISMYKILKGIFIESKWIWIVFIDLRNLNQTLV